MFSRRRKILLIILAVATVAWLGVIYAFSMQRGEVSSALSKAAAGSTAELLPQAGLSVTLLTIEKVLRKLAHMGEFAVLAVLLASLFTVARMRHPVYLSHLLCMLSGAMDELHQLFVPGRTSQVLDIVVDTLGACVGLFLFVIIRRIVLNRNRQRG